MRVAAALEQVTEKCLSSKSKTVSTNRAVPCRLVRPGIQAISSIRGPSQDRLDEPPHRGHLPDGFGQGGPA